MNKKFLFLLLFFQIAIFPSFSQGEFDKIVIFAENFSSRKLNPAIWGIDIAEFKGHNVYFSDKKLQNKKRDSDNNIKERRLQGMQLYFKFYLDETKWHKIRIRQT